MLAEVIFKRFTYKNATYNMGETFECEPEVIEKWPQYLRGIMEGESVLREAREGAEYEIRERPNAKGWYDIVDTEKSVALNVRALRLEEAEAALEAL